MSQPRYYRTLDDERSAQKRTELQLSPRRHTAKTVLSRPPSASDSAGTARLLVVALLLTLLATGLLVWAQLAGLSTSWAAVQAETDAWLAQVGLAPADGVAVAAATAALVAASPTAFPTETAAAAQPATSTPATAPTASPSASPTAPPTPTATSLPAPPTALAAEASPAEAEIDTVDANSGNAAGGDAGNVTNPPQPRWLPRLPRWSLPTVNLGRVLSRGPSAGDVAVAETGLVNAGFELLRMDSFDNRAPLLGAVEQPGRTAAPIPEEYRYAARLEANQVLWTTFEPSPDVASAKSLVAIETRALINAQTPDGYVALIARHQDDDNLYLFIVDGRPASAGPEGGGRFQVQLVQNGEWRTVQEWTASPALEAAGQLNVLSLADSVTDAGEPVLQLFVSDNSSLVTLYELKQPALPPGRLGVALGGGETGAEVSLNWLRLYGDAP